MQLRHIPTVGGSSLPLFSYKGAYDLLLDAKSVLQLSFFQHKGKTFKIPFTDRWIVVVTGKKLVDELQRLPDDAVSFIDAAGEVRSCLALNRNARSSDIYIAHGPYIHIWPSYPRGSLSCHYNSDPAYKAPFARFCRPLRRDSCSIRGACTRTWQRLNSSYFPYQCVANTL
ncbi:uncharacterized protein PHACADRAFT_109467 [Phanerochaete carnosa HHB-10118-sp]|uniref:Uncharacterized protein n=1 Tax=Phanerochaete carnosa (strain HHB-10118-sp) TaxID=650164 RepID=K5VN84_PHACS|nr:uncharacterized protein PHACADRAFT_109467 [Phanerochaete carnosa HHB-10118-sp]EKM48059.1 hypothetical protein PHACADRAFT_109467 [Phanerochaete carnosa HHB-10118-sp]